MTDVSALTDLPTPVVSDYLLSWRGSAPYRLALNYVMFKDANGYYQGALPPVIGDTNGYMMFAPKLGTSPFGANLDRFEIRIDPSNQVAYIGNTNSGTGLARDLAFNAGAAERVRIKGSNGNVGIGSGSPAGKLDVFDTASGGASYMRMINGSGTVNSYAAISFDPGNNGFNSRDGQIRCVNNGGNQITMQFLVANAATPAVAGQFDNALNFNVFGVKATINQKLLLQHDGTNAFIRPTNAGGTMYLGANNVNIAAVESAGFYSASDNAHILGGASNRWSVVYAVSGTINTSDEREKEWRGSLNKAELEAAKRIATEIGVYQWLDAIKEKGENARLHIGVRAQRVFKILEECELDWRRYAWCCYDKWQDEFEPIFATRIVKTIETRKPIVEDGTDEFGCVITKEIEEQFEVEIEEQYDTGEKRLTVAAGDRYGVRPDQLAMFLIAAQEQRLAALEDRYSDGK